MSGAHTWGNHRSPGLGPSQSHLIGHQHFFRSSWVPLLSRSTAALPCIPPPRGQNLLRKSDSSPRSLYFMLHVSPPPQRILERGSGPASRTTSSWDTGRRPEVGPPGAHCVWAGGAQQHHGSCDLCPLALDLCPFLQLSVCHAWLACTAGEGRLTKEGAPGGAYDSLALPWPPGALLATRGGHSADPT